MHVHHMLSVVTLYSSLWFMNFTVVFSVMVLFIEISTVFVCFRWLLYKHNLSKSFLATINTFIGALFFLFGRLTF